MSAPAQIAEHRDDAQRVRLGRLELRPDGLVRVALIATALVYLQTITYGFVYDDTLQIEMNPWVQSWEHWRLFFTGNVWSFVRANAAGSYYRPVFLLWTTANYSLFHSTPGWWHLASIAAHMVATVLVYAFAARLLRDRWLAALAAILFGVYPIHVEAVSWISSVPEVLVTVFILGALLALQNWIEHRQARWIGASLLLYAAAMLSKETALAFLPIAAVLSWSLESQPRTLMRIRSTLLRLSPYLAMTGLYLLARQAAIGSISASNFPRPASWVVLTWPSALWFYLRHLAWPFDLSVLYDFDLVRTFSTASVLLPAVGALAITAALCWPARKLGITALSLTWIGAPLLPVLVGMKVFPWYDYVHDRYLYLPSVMVAILIAAAIGRAPMARRWRIAVSLLVIGIFAAATIAQNTQWSSDDALFTRAYQRAPNNPVAADYHARILYGQGKTEQAFAEFQRLLRDHPDYWQGNYVLGLAYYQSGRYADAERYLAIATEIWPRRYLRPEATQFYYLGLTQQRRGAFKDAEKSFRRAIEIRPEAPGYRMALAQILKAQGDDAGAAEQLRLDAANRKTFADRQQGNLK